MASTSRQGSSDGNIPISDALEFNLGEFKLTKNPIKLAPNYITATLSPQREEEVQLMSRKRKASTFSSQGEKVRVVLEIDLSSKVPESMGFEGAESPIDLTRSPKDQEEALLKPMISSSFAGSTSLSTPIPVQILDRFPSSGVCSRRTF
ncbi:hypothetical protein ACH5RR_008799 [Cinchona calisaya]|uniref:Uncharacterized protein n=1 Tax=Cinchona calisaya TaxID=153742 RepID=A0ABD3AFD7_9GENT